MSSLSTSAPFGMFHNRVSHGNTTPPMRDLCITSNSGIVSGLSDLKAQGARCVWVLAGSVPSFQTIINGVSEFSMPMYQAKIDIAAAQIGSAQMDAFIRDGTIIGTYVNDDIEPGSVYPNGVSLATIEAQAAYCKTKWPNLPVGVRTRAGYLKNYSSTYTHLDFAWSQWRHTRGPAATFFQNEVNDARSKGLGTMAGFNLLNGGSGATAPFNEKPDRQGTTNFGMSPMEIDAVFAAYSARTTMIGIFGWTHDNFDPPAGFSETYYYDKTSIQTSLTAGVNSVSGRAMGPMNFKTSIVTSAETVTGDWAYIGDGSPTRNGDVAQQQPGLPSGFAAGQGGGGGGA
jgi:hypothetical protein